MTDVTFDFDWEDPRGARGPELRTTWARLEIRVAGESVTQILDRRSKTVRSYVYLPLYPVAEWIALHWWQLLYSSARLNLRHAREGFALPDLEILPLGESIQLLWYSTPVDEWDVRFLESGSALVPLDALRSELTRFVEAVLERLALGGVGATLLHEEWSRLQELTRQEKEFCRVAAALRLDPFQVTEEQESAILEAHAQLSQRPALEHEFFHAARIDDLSPQLARLLAAEKQVCREAADHHGISLERTAIDQRQAPWDQGYALARGLRQSLQLEERRFQDLHDLSSAFSSNGSPPFVEVSSDHLFEALTLERSPGQAVVALSSNRQRDQARSFAFCRALAEFMVEDGSMDLRMVTPGQTARQKRNRAFAAEFLAPSALLAERLPDSVVSSDVVEDLALDFGVDSMVIEHQIRNHHLADVRL